MFVFLQNYTVASAVGIVILIWLGRFFAKGYAVRKRFHNLPGPPHSWLWGHLKVMGEIMQDLPPRVHPAVVPMRLSKKYELPNYMFLDLWPAAEEMLAVFDKDIVQQITIDHGLPKHPGMDVFMVPLAGPGNLVGSNGAHWKKWRSIMNPGFAAQHLMTLVPSIVEHSIIFTEKLTEHAEKKEVFRLEEDATRLTVDIIGSIALDVQLGTQRGENVMNTAFREQVHLVPNEGAANPFKMWYPSGIYRRWRNTRIMNNYIGQILDERFAKQGPEANGAPAGQKKQRKRAVIDLALEAYRAQLATGEEEKPSGQDPSGISKEFRDAAITQMRTFLFAGHDTTSSTICYALYALQKHPECLARIREEHDSVLGSVESTPQLIKDDPHILNRLEYTTAVIRETLRMWTPASGTRLGDSEHIVRDPDTGERLPVEDLLIWIVSISHHRNPKTWGETANVFDPTRFLPENAAKLPENAWRPFEKGPRNCIGQDLAMIEARTILSLVVRKFEFTMAYDSLDELKNDDSYYSKDSSFRRGRQDWDGEEAYPVLVSTAKPREGMPVRVKIIC